MGNKRDSQNSRKYFVSQQKAIGELDGYVEEMINGQEGRQDFQS